ncbi:hypothetical protein CQY20_30160 [Mycolicibacterium agri]|uniref:Uncharacterized protein n=1 Tax=Mycolicibacterium agri TaxID=36811 RepID=A0A2A7MPV3_MYCAG|nr:hypothetical protein [Mycolicibacterium agri]PEG33547.1 hypothetical protein CQY20_30160 [Mycolicibacterium agri]GFG52952.1 hypothetical protein MAGR_43930 [Mycolicibacterium agri]
MRREQVEAFIGNSATIGTDYLGRYVVCTTSGSTGTPAIFLHDHSALTVYNVERADEPPQLHPTSGKFRQVYTEYRA